MDFIFDIRRPACCMRPWRSSNPMTGSTTMKSVTDRELANPVPKVSMILTNHEHGVEPQCKADDDDRHGKQNPHGALLSWVFLGILSRHSRECVGSISRLHCRICHDDQADCGNLGSWQLLISMQIWGSPSGRGRWVTTSPCWESSPRRMWPAGSMPATPSSWDAPARPPQNAGCAWGPMSRTGTSPGSVATSST